MLPPVGMIPCPSDLVIVGIGMIVPVMVCIVSLHIGISIFANMRLIQFTILGIRMVNTSRRAHKSIISRLHAVTKRSLTFQQITLFFIRLGIDVKFNQCILVYRDYVIETQQAVSSPIEFHNMLARFHVDMVRFRGFHRNKILESDKTENYVNIGPAILFLLLDIRIPTSHKPDIMVVNFVNPKVLHSLPLFLYYEEWRDGHSPSRHLLGPNLRHGLSAAKGGES